MIMALESSGVPITGDSIKTKLLQEVKTLDNEKHKSVGSDTAYYFKKRPNKNHSRKGPKCFNCEKIGHIAADCRNNKSKDNSSKPKRQEKVKAFLSGKEKLVEEDLWFIDSGASTHMSRNKKIFEQIKPYKSSKIVTADNAKLKVEGIGDVKIKIKDKDGIQTITAKNVLYVPEITANLLSVSQMTKKNLTINFNKKGCTIYDEDMLPLATAKLRDEVYYLNQPLTRAFTCKEYTDSELWHKRLGHLNRNGMKCYVTNMQKD